MNAAREKVEAEGRCRTCDDPRPGVLDAAHLIPRSVKSGQGFEDPDGIVPLCSRIKGGAGCHDDYDAHRLELLPYLTLDEQLAAVRLAGGIEAARVQLCRLAQDEEGMGTEGRWCNL